jgi:hypothetical protein
MTSYADLWAPVLVLWAVGCGGSIDDDGAGGGGSTSPGLTAACSSYCNKAAALSCTSEEGLSKCNSECTAVGTAISSCAGEWESALSCMVDEGTLACSPTGGVSVTGCAAERGAASTCLAVAGEEACKGYCQKYLALSCVDQDQATCESQCDQAMGMFCTTDMLLVYTCAAKRGVFSCDAENEVQVTGCEPEQAALQECFDDSVVDPAEP